MKNKLLKGLIGLSAFALALNVNAATLDSVEEGSNTYYDVVLDFNFQPFYTVTYTDITNNDYPTEILGGNTLTVNFGESAPSQLILKMGNIEINDYTYENGVLTVPNVSDNVEVIKDDTTITNYKPQYYSWSYGTVGGDLPSDAKITVAELNPSYPFYLGLDVEAGKVTAAYACFTRNETEYCLKGYYEGFNTNDYEKNKIVLEDAFKDVENACSFVDGSSYCGADGVYADADSIGHVGSSGDDAVCIVNSGGHFECYEY